jgi:hypothetical protein
MVALNASAQNDNADISLWPLTDILDVAGGSVYEMGPFNAFCEKHRLFEFLTEDFVGGLVEHLQASQVRLQKQKRMVVLEVGAGKGFLAYHMTERLQKHSGGTIDYVATDIWPLQGPFSANIISDDYQAALTKFKPDIVLCSWMPMSMDWSKYFRHHGGVQEYILIGEADHGACGDNWETWGNHLFHPSVKLPALRDMLSLPQEKVVHIPDDIKALSPPYTADGWQKWPLDHISQFQLQRFDTFLHHGNSQTVSFTKS